MTGGIYSTRPSLGLSERLKLSSTESFKLFGEGLLALSEYEKRADKHSVKTAESYLKDCTQKYPQDLLPWFYLGIVETYLGGMDQSVAIECFRTVLRSGEETLRLPACYNLAVAHIQQHTAGDFEKAQEILNQTLNELRNHPRNKRASELLLQTWIDSLFVRVSTRLWEESRKGTKGVEHLRPVICELRQELQEFDSELENNKEVATEQMLADRDNTKGLFFESIAYLSSSGERSRNANDAVLAFGRALVHRPNWAPPKANKARVYYELLDKPDNAAEIWLELTYGTEEAEYSHYCLGKYYFEKRADYSKAVLHLKLAQRIRSACKLLALIYQEKLKRPQDAKQTWQDAMERFANDQAFLKTAEDALKSLSSEPHA